MPSPPIAALGRVQIKQDVSVKAPIVSIEEIRETEDVPADPEINLSTLNLDLTATYIKSSPYDDPVNFLNLQDLDLPNRLFALALTQLQSARTDYATAPYLESFNWSTVFAVLRRLCTEAGRQWQRQEFYLVIFRSRLLPTADRERLGELDKNSHEEACASGGLLTYWFGSPDAEWRNLATCIWRNREDAAAGGKGPWHRKARGAAREMYESISFHTHRFVVDEGAHTWRMEEYHD